MCSPRGQPGCDAGQRVRSTYWIPGPLVESRLSGKLLGALSRTLSKGLSKGLSKELSKGLLKGAAQRGCSKGLLKGALRLARSRQRKVWKPKGRQGTGGRRQRGRQLAVHLSQQMDAAQHWDGSGMCGQVVWICFGSCSLLGRGAYRSTAMVAVIKAEAFCYLQVLLSHLL